LDSLWQVLRAIQDDFYTFADPKDQAKVDAAERFILLFVVLVPVLSPVNH
jgi:hypothetical protein